MSLIDIISRRLGWPDAWGGATFTAYARSLSFTASTRSLTFFAVKP